MSLQSILNHLLDDSGRSLQLFLPELVLCATIVLILLFRIVKLTERVDSFYLALAGSAVGLWFAAVGLRDLPTGREELFTGLLVFDPFTAYFRTVLLFFAVLFALFTRVSEIPDRDAATDFYPLVLGATLGMCLMASANHLLMVFMAVEMASVPSYVLAGLLKGRRKSSEAALKYAIYGAGTAGVMLYGISLLAGVLGSVHLPTMAVRLAELLDPARAGGPIGPEYYTVLILGGLMLMVGLAFKLSAVPFHFWCPDVFEGASAEVNAFLSVASKAAALALLVRVTAGIGFIPTDPNAATQPTAMYNVADAPAAADAPPRELLNLATPPATAADVRAAHNAALAPARAVTSQFLAFLAIVTCTFGNLAAYGQTNIKRLLAYSTIAHAGYMIMPIAAAVKLAESDPAGAEAAIGALTLYVGIYLFMNTAAFAIVAFLRNVLGSEEISSYAGLVRRAPIVVVCFGVVLFSLIGLPPLAGFIGKFAIFTALVNAQLWTLLVVAGLNTAISLYYYLKVVKAMTFDPEPREGLTTNLSFVPGTFVVALCVPIALLGVWPHSFNQWAQAAARYLFS